MATSPARHFGVVGGPGRFVGFGVIECFADHVFDAHAGGGIAKVGRVAPNRRLRRAPARFGFSPSANLMPGMAPSNFMSSAFLPQRIFMTMVLPPMELALPCRMLAVVTPPASAR